MHPSHIVIFDGVCVLCESSIRFIVKHDKARLFKFAAAQSEAGKQIQSQWGVEAMASQTMILIKEGRVYQKSEAALEIAGSLDGPWRALTVLKVIPKWLRDPIYSVIARQRYRWFGRKAACMMPDESLKDRFL